MKIEIEEFEKQKIEVKFDGKRTMTDGEINEKYSSGEQIIVVKSHKK